MALSALGHPQLTSTNGLTFSFEGSVSRLVLDARQTNHLDNSDLNDLIGKKKTFSGAVFMALVFLSDQTLNVITNFF